MTFGWATVLYSLMADDEWWWMVMKDDMFQPVFDFRRNFNKPRKTCNSLGGRLELREFTPTLCWGLFFFQHLALTSASTFFAAKSMRRKSNTHWLGSLGVATWPLDSNGYDGYHNDTYVYSMTVWHTKKMMSTCIKDKKNTPNDPYFVDI